MPPPRAVLGLGAITAVFASCLFVGVRCDSNISQPITVTYKQINGVPLLMDIFPVGDRLVTNVSKTCLAELIHYCPKSYNRDPTCSECVSDHHIHILAAGCPQDVFLVQNFYCDSQPAVQGADSERRSHGDTAQRRAVAQHADDLRPLLVYIHGGGWSHGSRKSVPDYVRQLAQDQRYALASIDYRLTSQGALFGGDSAVIWPSQREDCLDALQYLHDHASQYGADNRRTACIGTSAGAHLCSVMATYGRRYQTTSLKLAVPLYGPTNLVNMTQDIDPAVGCRLDHDAVDSFESRLLGSAITNVSVAQIRANLNNPTAPWPALVALATTSNPVNYVDADTPAMFVAHGNNDTLVPFKQSQRLVDALLAEGIEHVFYPAIGCNHASEPRDCWQAAATAAQQWLIDRL